MGLNPKEDNQWTTSDLLSPWSSIQLPFQVPPVPKLVFILLSRLIRIFEFTRGGNPAMVVTVFPPRPLFSLRTSNRSPLPIRSSTFGFLGLPVFSETPGAASGKPIESKAEKGESPKFSAAVTGRFPSFRSLFRLILRKRLFRVLHPPTTTRPFRSFCFQENASVSDANPTRRPSRFHPSAEGTSPTLQALHPPAPLSSSSIFQFPPYVLILFTSLVLQAQSTGRATLDPASDPRYK